MTAPSKLVRSGCERECKDCHKVIVEGELYYRRSKDDVTYCKECYKQRRMGWDKRQESGREKRQRLLEILLEGEEPSAKELCDRFGGYYILLLRELKTEGYPICKFQDNRTVRYVMKKDRAECIVCGKIFQTIPMDNRIPDFLCGVCKDKMSRDKRWLFTRVKLNKAPYLLRGVEPASFIDDPVLDTIQKPSDHRYCEEVLDRDDDSSSYGSGFNGFSGPQLVHLAAKAKLKRMLYDEEVAMALCLGLGKIRCRTFNEYQKWGERVLNYRLSACGVFEEPCMEEPCSFCAEARNWAKGGGTISPESIRPSTRTRARRKKRA